MKKLTLTLLTTVLTVFTLSAQNLYIYKTDGTVVEVSLSTIDSITFTNGGGGSFQCGVSNVSDIDGNVYNTVLIGSQCWLGKNLKTTKFNDGTEIPNVTDNPVWDTISTPAYCWYDNNQSYKDPYGALYNGWVFDPSVNGGKQICPEGWHIPNDDEWTTLTDFLGGLNVAGGKLKEAGTAHWNAPNSGATNETGFTALPAGYRGTNSNFTQMGDINYLWSSTTHASYSTSAWWRSLSSASAGVYRHYLGKKLGMSVRCLKD
jgi:uncharacterized protein (TIGR02145 family)